MCRFLSAALMCFLYMAVLAELEHHKRKSSTRPPKNNSLHDPADKPADEQSQNEQNVCITLQSALQGGRLLLAGILDDNLILITSGSPATVYSISVTRIKDDGIHLAGVVPQPLSKKWGIIANSKAFQKQVISGKPFGSLMIQIDKATLMLFVIGSSQPITGFFSVAAQVKPSLNVSRKSYLTEVGITFGSTMWISSNEPGNFYMLFRATEISGVMLFKYHWKDGIFGLGPTSKLRMCTTDTQVAFTDPNQVSGNLTCDFAFNWEWTRFRGFTDGKSVYLFAPDTVYKFSVQAMAQLDKWMPLTKHPFSNFLVCPVPTTVENIDIDFGTTEHSGSSIMLFVIIIVVIIFICGGGAAGFFLCRGKDKGAGGVDDEAGGDKVEKNNSSNIQTYMKDASDVECKKNDEDTASTPAGGSNSKAGKSNVESNAGSNPGGSNYGGSNPGGESTATVASSAKRPGMKTKKAGGSSSTRTALNPKAQKTSMMSKKGKFAKGKGSSKKSKKSSASKKSAKSKGKSNAKKKK